MCCAFAVRNCSCSQVNVALAFRLLLLCQKEALGRGESGILVLEFFALVCLDGIQKALHGSMADF